MADSISVITVTYNNKLGLEKTLNSILQQTYENIYVYVIDGASQDGSLELLSKYERLFQQSEKRFKYISEKDSGIYDAMNKGIDLAKEPWLIFMNAGDVFYDKKTLENIFKDDVPTDAAILYGRWKKTDGIHVSDGVTYYFEEMKGKQNIKGLKKYPNNGAMVTSHQAIFFRTKLLKARKYDLDYKIVADMEWIVYAKSKKMKMVFLDQYICLFDDSGVSNRKLFEKYTEAVRMRHAYNINDCFFIEKLKIIVWFFYDKIKGRTIK